MADRQKRRVSFKMGHTDQREYNNLLAMTGEAKINGIIAQSFTYDPASLNSGSGETKTTTVIGARLGDVVICGPGISITNLIISASVQSADTVAVHVHNQSGSAINIASSMWWVLVFQMS